MSPVQKTQLDNMAERIYTDITALHHMTASLMRTSEVQEREELDKVRQSLRAAAMRLDALSLLRAVTAELETPDLYTPHERKTCQACAHGCCAMTSDVA